MVEIIYKCCFKILEKAGFYHNAPVEKLTKARFRAMLEYKLNLDCPKTFNEKLQWLKLYWKNPIQIKCADKYAVREFVAEKCGDKILNKLYAVYDSVDEIKWEQLPEWFVIKANHGSGMNIICKKKSELNISEACQRLKKWMNTDYSKRAGEWFYAEMPKKIIIEEYLENESMGELPDYKLFCFNGKVKMFKVDLHRFMDGGKGHQAIYYDLNWEKIPVKEGKYGNIESVSKPEKLDEMIENAEKLAENIPFVRVDFYEVKGKLYFGEMTFLPAGGSRKYYPQQYDEIWGSWLRLPSGE